MYFGKKSPTVSFLPYDFAQKAHTKPVCAFAYPAAAAYFDEHSYPLVGTDLYVMPPQWPSHKR
jgi:hypothetical protein